ncbi:uncharacterized protein CXQ87_004171 [Candidozyma duobushaemuli]|uniref:Cell wall mannoprotein PIR1-like C-terminal domain-containing protein n=2 Tax=Candidozyma TaxID=3303203 RepID=A0ABX8IE35_9ASCO|nr:uncharacterized protein CXQ87_004171 [[Candida] duobushaemulonis]PVH16299.1 hypothetical protein CXQ87_004171 [[Candida] duobushaemulonis]QWU89036.1 hypothetical protein CA3LBN_003359 [[Candida] haemuloni]
MIFLKTAPFFFVALSSALYDPSSGADWRQLKPTSPKPQGALSSIPFPVGIVTKAFVWVDGRWKPPCDDEEIEILEDDDLPTKWADIHQIDVGQVLRPDLVDGPPQRKPILHEEPEYDESDCPDELEEPPLPDPELPCDEADFEDLDPNDIVGGPVSVVPEHRLHKRDKRSETFNSPIKFSSCTEEDTLVMYLDNGVLRDPENRIGSIVGNHQFQFDGPTPQYGALYAAGWSVTPNSLLSLGDQTTFFQCSAGDFHKTYDTAISDQCVPVQLEVVKLESEC